MVNKNKIMEEHFFIESFQNKKLRPFKKNHKQDNQIIIQGLNTVKEALKAGLIQQILINEKYFVDIINELKNTSSKILVTSNINMEKIFRQKKINKVLALINKENIIKDYFNTNFLILDNIQDPINLGLLIRSASAFNFKNILLSKNSVNPYTYKVINASQGMFFKVCIKRIDTLEFVKNIKSANILGTYLNDQSTLLDESLQFNNNHKKTYLILGNEGYGIDKEYKKYITNNIKIKMHDNINSLNLAIAGSIIMFYIFNKVN